GNEQTSLLCHYSIPIGVKAPSHRTTRGETAGLIGSDTMKFSHYPQKRASKQQQASDQTRMPSLNN
ncbi:MAG: hypothetical protein RR619_11115, partial [Raoultibacter sp.]